MFIRNFIYFYALKGVAKYEILNSYFNHALDGVAKKNTLPILKY